MIKIQINPNPGLGTAFFCVQNVPFFPVLKRERYILFRSFLEFLATYETQKNVTFFSVLFKRTEKNGKNGKNVTFFYKEREERNVLLQRTEKNARTSKRTGERYVLFSRYIQKYIQIYIDIYRHIYIEKRTERSLKRTERSFSQDLVRLGWLGQEKNGKERSILL